AAREPRLLSDLHQGRVGVLPRKRALVRRIVSRYGSRDGLLFKVQQYGRLFSPQIEQRVLQVLVDSALQVHALRQALQGHKVPPPASKIRMRQGTQLLLQLLPLWFHTQVHLVGPRQPQTRANSVKDFFYPRCFCSCCRCCCYCCMLD
ncbi:uncharacterized protein LOC111643800, partial [Copidosoma floridanum]|uniref:uncharacterized protein LOC111643800 n=1 Tax=Copidosoma floridanum TaxID=29053 RepID=UPI000C6F8CA0